MCSSEISTQPRYFNMSRRSWNSSLPCGLFGRPELTLIHSKLAEEMWESITLYGSLLSQLHFICHSVPTALSHHAFYYWSGNGRIFFQHDKPCVTGSSLLKQLLQTGNVACHLPKRSIIYITITFLIWHVNCLNVCSCICPSVIFGLVLCMWIVFMWGFTPQYIFFKCQIRSFYVLPGSFTPIIYLDCLCNA